MTMYLHGIFIIAELDGEAGRRVREINERFDPKLARSKPPHITIAGSSGLGPIHDDMPAGQLREKLTGVSTATAPMSLRFGPPLRFMQTDIVVLPLDPHGAIRELHDRIRDTGLPFSRPRFPFSPHCTLSLYQSLTPDKLRDLLSIRVREPAVIDRIQVYRSLDPQPARLLLDLPLTGTS